jgi:hypothetical protein
MPVIEAAKTLARSPAAKWLAVPLCAGLGYGWSEYRTDAESKAGAAPTATRPSSPKTSLTFKVASGRTFDNGFTILNDRADFREDGTLTVVCNKDALPKGIDSAEQLIGKTITAEGRHAKYQGRDQLRASKVAVK